MSIQLYQPTTHIPAPAELVWEMPPANPYRKFFDFRAAIQSVINHLDSLPSAHTPERHTHKVYLPGMKYFINFLNDELPTPEIMRAYVAHLSNRKLKASTINARYLTPARHFCNALATQPLQFESVDDAKMLFGLPEWREQIRQAADCKDVQDFTHTDISPLFDPKFHRLSIQQVNAVLRGIDTSTLSGLRDYAILHVAFSSALRLAEIARLTLSNITPADGGYIVTVRGKRSNMTPVPIATRAVEDIRRYVEAFNADLSLDDPRRITEDTPLWQPLLKGKHHPAATAYVPSDGISNESVRQIIRKHAEKVCPGFNPHDTRRTAAALAYDAGMPLPQIQKMLRHKDPGTTLRYIGQKPDYASSNLNTYGITFG